MLAPTPARAPINLATPVSGIAPSTPAKPERAHEGTVREILPPWEVIQQKLAGQGKGTATPSSPSNEVINQAAQEALLKQEAEAANWCVKDESPSSGVRMSEPGPAAPQGLAAGASTAAGSLVDDDGLSFKVYTVGDLERRSDAPVSIRSSQNLDQSVSRTSKKNWPAVAAALKAFAIASLEWFKIKGMRPSPKVALRKPFDALGDELQIAVESIDWKKLGVTTGIVVGATLTLLFAVLTAAELTDDLKPTGASHLASTETSGGIAASAAAANGVQPVSPLFAAPNAISITSPAPAANDGVIAGGEIDGPDPVAAPTAKKPAAKKPAAAAKPKTTKLTLRNAPF